MKKCIAGLLAMGILVVIYASPSFALVITSSSYGYIDTWSSPHGSYVHYAFSDTESATYGSVTSYSDENSVNIVPDRPYPLQTNLQVSASAVATSSGTLMLSSQLNKPGGMDRAIFNATASWSDTLLNSTDETLNYLLSVDISPIDLLLTFGIGEAGRASASYAIDILLNGNSIWSNSGGIMTDLAPSYYPPYDPDCFTMSMYVPATTLELDLGSYLPGGSFDLEYIARVNGSLTDAVERGSFVGPFTVS